MATGWSKKIGMSLTARRFALLVILPAPGLKAAAQTNSILGTFVGPGSDFSTSCFNPADDGPSTYTATW